MHLIHHHKRFIKAAPLPPRIGAIHFHRSKHMSLFNIPITVPTQRKDGKELAVTEIAFIDIEMSADNGQNYVSVGHAANNQAAFQQDLTVPGTYLFRGVTVDTQVPPLSSDPSSPVSVTIAPPALAAPNPPVLGTITPA
jgi:hypothetical protein